jgi:hypothetical protein
MEEEMEECSAELWACGGRDEIGCISSASDSEDDLYLPYHHDDSLECQAPLADHPDRPGGAASAADAVADDTSTRQFCCCSLAPLEHQTQLICEQLLSRGWHCHPAEIVPGASTFSPDGRGRPEAGRRVDFSNSAHHSAGYLFSDDPCEALFDRLQLAGLTRGTDICPLTVCLRGGPSGWGQLEVQQQLAAVGDAPGGGCVFLKENFEHFGTGTRVFSSVAEALAALASELAEGDRQQTQDFVLQPHVPRPMLWHRRKFHVRVWALYIAQPSTTRRGVVRAWLHDRGTVAVATDPWQLDAMERTSQVTSKASPRFVYHEWETYPAAHAAITANAIKLSRQLASSWRGRVVRRPHFSLAGLDYILDEDCTAHLLEANFGSKLVDVEMVEGLVSVVFYGEDGAAQGWRSLG